MPATDDLEAIHELLTGKSPSPDVNDYVKGRLTAVIAAESHKGAGRSSLANHSLGGFKERLLAQRKAAVAQPDSTAADPQARRRARRPRPTRPLLLTSAASAALAAGLAVALIVTPGTVRSPGGGASPKFAPAVTAAAVLHNAALAALAVPAVTPRPDQFVYSKVYSRDTGWPKSEGMNGTAVYQTWLSVSGTRAGLQSHTGGRGHGTHPMLACMKGRVIPPSLAGPPSRSHCTAAYFAGYLPGMPTRPAALLAWLVRTYHIASSPAGVTGWRASLLQSTIENVLFTRYLTPAQHAAMYELLARTPGMKAVPQATALLGRTGVGVRWTFRPGGAGTRSSTDTYTLVFSRKTYQVLGMNWTGSTSGGGAVPTVAIFTITTGRGRPDLKGGTGGTGGESLIKLAIVNKPGELP